MKPLIALNMLLLLTHDLAALIDADSGATSTLHAESGVLFVGALPMDTSEIALLDSSKCSWVVVAADRTAAALGGTEPVRHPAPRLCGALDAVRFGELGYVLLSTGTLQVVEPHGALRLRRTYRSLLPGPLASGALALGPSSLYVMTNSMANLAQRRGGAPPARPEGCTLQLLDRHARRSVGRMRGFGEACSELAPHPDGGLIALDGEGGLDGGGGLGGMALRHVGSGLGGCDGSRLQSIGPHACSSSNVSTLWRCDACCRSARPDGHLRCPDGRLLRGLAMIDRVAFTIALGDAAPSHSREGREAGAAPRLMAIPLRGTARIRSVPLPSLNASRLDRCRLLAPSYLSRPVYRRISLHAKRDAAGPLASRRGRDLASSSSRFRTTATRPGLHAASRLAASTAFQHLPPPSNTSGLAASSRLAMLGAVDIEAARAAILSQWPRLWRHGHAAAAADGGATALADAEPRSGGRARDLGAAPLADAEPQSFAFLFPGLAGGRRIFQRTLSAKLLFSGPSANMAPRVRRLLEARRNTSGGGDGVEPRTSAWLRRLEEPGAVHAPASAHST